eukprot:jgi/Tetstr1/447259/TSEL_034696.t1
MPRRTITLDNCLDDNSVQASEPANTGVRLFPHQKASLYAMNNLEMTEGIASPACSDERLKTRIGVLGDKPGAGKSFVMLALALSGRRTSSFNGVNEYSISLHASLIRKDSRAFTPTSIIVIPHGLSKQWGEYLEQYMPKDTNNILINRRKQFTEVTPDKLQNGFYTVIIITTTMLPSLVSKLNGTLNLRVSRVFYDECDGIDVKHSSYIHAGFYWFVSASFHNLLTPRGGMVTLPDGNTVRVYGYYNSHLRMFFDPFQGVNEDLVKHLAIFCDEGFIDRSLNLPEPRVHTVVCKTPYSVRVLSGNVRGSIIRALNAGDVDAAVRSMGAIADTESNLVSSVVDGYRREKRALEARINYIDDYVHQSQGQRDSERARCNARIAVLDRNLTTISERAPVRLETCMVCRDGGAGSSAELPEETGAYVVDDIEFVHKGTKLQNLTRLLLETDSARKFLVFSEYDFILEQSISEALRANGVRYGMLKRNIHTINKVVNEFKTGDLRVLLINSAHYGCGMNLPEATDVVLMHKLKEGKSYKQVVGRAQRCQRSTPLNVWRFFNENEVQDEALDELLVAPPSGGGHPAGETRSEDASVGDTDDGDSLGGYSEEIF